MAEAKHLENAPITEAIIDFRIKPKEGFRVDKFLELKSALAKEYPKVQKQQLIEGGFEIAPGKPVKVSKTEGIGGYWFISSDGLNLAQFRVDGFTYNRFKPYTDWEAVFPEAWRLWGVFKDTGAVEFVTRIATRFINRLTLPSPVSDLDRYLTVPPQTPAGISGNTANFLTRILVDIKEIGAAASITQALDKSVDPNTIVVILDIDVFVQKQFRLAIDDSVMIKTFSGLRDLKNRIFFSSVTDETLRLFE